MGINRNSYESPLRLLQVCFFRGFCPVEQGFRRNFSCLFGILRDFPKPLNPNPKDLEGLKPLQRFALGAIPAALTPVPENPHKPQTLNPNPKPKH